jgi:hypothetical protein
MFARLCLVLALAGMPSLALAQSGQQYPGVVLYDRLGRPLGTVENPLTSSGGASGGGGSATAATGGISAFSRLPSSAASSNLTNAKASAGRAYTYQGCNTTASTIYLRVYNAASTGAVTVGATAPFAGPYAFPANTCVQTTAFADAIGIYASAGITYAFGTTPADTDATAIGAGSIAAFQIGYQ